MNKINTNQTFLNLWAKIKDFSTFCPSIRVSIKFTKLFSHAAEILPIFNIIKKIRHKELNILLLVSLNQNITINLHQYINCFNAIKCNLSRYGYVKRT